MEYRSEYESSCGTRFPGFQCRFAPTIQKPNDNSNEQCYAMFIREINYPIVWQGEYKYKCIDLAAYKEGCKLAETLSVLEITAKGDYEDFCGEPLGICGPYYYSETFDDELNFARDAYKLLSI